MTLIIRPQGTTIIDSALSDLAGAAEHPDSNLHDRTWKNKIFHDFAREVLQEDSVVGPLFLRGILNWVQHTRSQLPCEMKFSTFPNYVDYRIKDFAVEYVLPPSFRLDGALTAIAFAMQRGC